MFSCTYSVNGCLPTQTEALEVSWQMVSQCGDVSSVCVALESLVWHTPSSPQPASSCTPAHWQYHTTLCHLLFKSLPSHPLTPGRTETCVQRVLWLLKSNLYEVRKEALVHLLGLVQQAADTGQHRGQADTGSRQAAHSLAHSRDIHHHLLGAVHEETNEECLELVFR